MGAVSAEVAISKLSMGFCQITCILQNIYQRKSGEGSRLDECASLHAPPAEGATVVQRGYAASPAAHLVLARDQLDFAQSIVTVGSVQKNCFLFRTWNTTPRSSSAASDAYLQEMKDQICKNMCGSDLSCKAGALLVAQRFGTACASRWTGACRELT